MLMWELVDRIKRLANFLAECLLDPQLVPRTAYFAPTVNQRIGQYVLYN